MKQNKYTLPAENDEAFAAEQNVYTAKADDLRCQLMNRLMEIDDPKTLQSLIFYVDRTILKLQDSFEKEWQRGVSVEEFRKQCHDTQKEMYG